MTGCIINYAPFLPELYEFAEKTLGGDDGNLLKVAHFFSVIRYFQPIEEKEQRDASFREYQKNAEEKPKAFFGSRLHEAEAFLSTSQIYDDVYCIVEDVLSPDFNDMIRHLLDFRTYIKDKGEEDGPLFDRRTRRRMIFFEFDSPSKLGKQTFIRQFCDTCHAKLMPGEEAFAFIDITSTWTRREGILITNRGFYLSESCNAVRPGSPLLYERISRIVCDPVMKIEYDGAIVKPKLPSNEKIRNFLIFSCMYFKFGQFEE